MKRAVIAVSLLLVGPGLVWALRPDTRTTTVTGTIGKPDAQGTAAATLGHSGVLFIRTEARWEELQDRLGAAVPIDAELPKIDFTRQCAVMVFADGRRPADNFTLSNANPAANPPRLDLLLGWNNGPEEKTEIRTTGFILVALRAASTAHISVFSQALPLDPKSPMVSEFSAVVGDKDGGDVVDGLRARITPKAAVVSSGDDILIDFELQLADPGEAKPERFAFAPKSILVWDGKYSNGYRNHAFFVTTPDGKTTLLRPKEITKWDKNAPHPVEVMADKPYHLPNWVEGDTHKSLKALGLDTSAPGAYAITGLYEETATGERGESPMWGGSIASNTIIVHVKAPTTQRDGGASGQAAGEDGSVSGTAVDADGKPMAGATVRVVDVTEGRRPAVREAKTGDDGSFKIEKLPSGSFLLSAWAFRGRDTTLVHKAKFAVTGGKNTDVGKIALEPEKSVPTP